jgi:hypothetical protein
MVVGFKALNKGLPSSQAAGFQAGRWRLDWVQKR